jgi:hypothetical protein
VKDGRGVVVDGDVAATAVDEGRRQRVGRVVNNGEDRTGRREGVVEEGVGVGRSS